MRMHASSIFEFIQLKREGERWDYKEKYPECKAELLHDILCLANALAKGDRYLILGVSNFGEVVGVEEDSNRKRQADLIDFLRSKKFAGEYRPSIELNTLQYEDHEIDVLTVKDTTDTPYYLIEDYTDKKEDKFKTVKASYIYSRVGDTNTPINKSADLYAVEKLWRKRFGIDTPPLERVGILLDDTSNWDMDIGNRRYGFCKSTPEYRLVMTELRACQEPCAYFYTNEAAYRGKLRIMYHSTILYETSYWAFDEMRRIVPEFWLKYIEIQGQQHWFYYYIKNSLQGKLLRLFTGGTYDLSSREPEECFLLFSKCEEVECFSTYAKENYDCVQSIPLSHFGCRAQEREERDGKIGIRVDSSWRMKQLFVRWKG